MEIEDQIAALREAHQNEMEALDGEYSCLEDENIAMEEAIEKLQAENDDLKEMLAELLAHDGMAGSEDYHALKLYDAREKAFKAIGGRKADHVTPPLEHHLRDLIYEAFPGSSSHSEAKEIAGRAARLIIDKQWTRESSQ